MSRLPSYTPPPAARLSTQVPRYKDVEIGVFKYLAPSIGPVGKEGNVLLWLYYFVYGDVCIPRCVPT